MTNAKGKMKDNLSARRDLEHLKIRPELHLITRPENKPYQTKPSYTMDENRFPLFAIVFG